ncbi:hypothetical protein DMB65_14255 [Flavobacterium cheongpyeongense]|uniref:Signal peptidase n=1 Tax=Flavobacterium cheongpyeongense TaxID=2212651 RepID=A0A2V4BQJ2_9FLAO|nr:hypothetical protein [Flavobacterium cheongpyeongense]PXY40223.1 hypothetical protein DMB65_14255 [Flavobacterium cheongpyeongense]
MKMMNKILTVVFLLLGNFTVFAQPPGPGNGPPQPPAPIDGVGLLILVLAAILLGMYVIYKHKLKTKASE